MSTHSHAANNAVLEMCIEVARQHGFRCVRFDAPFHLRKPNKMMAAMKKHEATLHADPKVIYFTTDRRSCMMFSMGARQDIFRELMTDAQCRYIYFARSRDGNRIRTTFIPTDVADINSLRQGVEQFMRASSLPSDTECCICMERHDEESSRVSCPTCNATMHFHCYNRMPRTSDMILPSCPKCRSPLGVALELK